MKTRAETSCTIFTDFKFCCSVISNMHPVIEEGPSKERPPAKKNNFRGLAKFSRNIKLRVAQLGSKSIRLATEGSMV